MFYISALLALPIAALIFFTIKEEAPAAAASSKKNDDDETRPLVDPPASEDVDVVSM